MVKQISKLVKTSSRKAMPKVAPIKKMSTKKQSTSSKGGFKGMDCPYTKAQFMKKAEETTITLKMPPKCFANKGFGWQKSAGVVAVEVGGKKCYTNPSCIAHVLGSKDGIHGLPAKTFTKKADELVRTFDVVPCEFSTGSFGWAMHCKEDMQVGGKSLRVQMSCNVPIRGTANSKDEDPELDDIDEGAIEKHFGTIGGRTKKRDNLTLIRGIGPWIQRRLNKIGISTFSQIASMTPEIEEDVNVAIKYFPGRASRDGWVDSAKTELGITH